MLDQILIYSNPVVSEYSICQLDPDSIEESVILSTLSLPTYMKAEGDTTFDLK